jgi:hypothetical protein
LEKTAIIDRNLFFRQEAQLTLRSIRVSRAQC